MKKRISMEMVNMTGFGPKAWDRDEERLNMHTHHPEEEDHTHKPGAECRKHPEKNISGRH